MPLFEDFGKRFSEAAKAVGRRTQEAADVVKLNGRISTMQDEIEKLFLQVGKAYYAVRGAGQNDAADQLCAQIDKLMSDQKAVREELDRIRNTKRCPNCGEVQALSAAFCASCGTKMPDEPKPEPKLEPVITPESEPAMEQPGVTIEWPPAPEQNGDSEQETEGNE